MATIPTGKVDPGTVFILGRNWSSPEEYYEHAVSVAPTIYLVTLIVGLLPIIILAVGLAWAAVRPKLLAALSLLPAAAKLSETQEKQMLKLSEARRAASHLRYRVSFVLIQVGWMLTAATFVPVLFYMQGQDAGPVAGSPLLYLGINALVEPIFLLAIFPTDARLIRCISVGQGFFNFFLGQ